MQRSLQPLLSVFLAQFQSHSAPCPSRLPVRLHFWPKVVVVLVVGNSLEDPTTPQTVPGRWAARQMSKLQEFQLSKPQSPIPESIKVTRR